ncbi:MAG TPA: hypothetical protein VHY10_01015 [Xanthobacteraceae bacterium]|jgi:hypothetical protein|nr:hypothetical protein [Xanthobacteraceae bacterium]
MRRVLLVLAGAVAVAGCASLSPLSTAQAADMGTIRAACAAMGLNPSEAPFIYCVHSLANSAPVQPYAMNTPTAMSDAGDYRAPGTGTGISHNAASACAAIGLDPATARFSYCVGDLNHTLFDTETISSQ